MIEEKRGKEVKNTIVQISMFSILLFAIIAGISFIVLQDMIIVKEEIRFAPEYVEILDVKENYTLDEPLIGTINLVVEEGDSIDKDELISLTLSKDDEIINKSTITFEQYMRGQADYTQINTTGLVCINQTEICENATQQNCTNETILLCENQTIENVTQEICQNGTQEICQNITGLVCTNQTGNQTEICENATTSKYYYTQPGNYTKAIQDLIPYTFTTTGSYQLELNIDVLGTTIIKSLIVQSASGDNNQTSNDTQDNNSPAQNQTTKTTYPITEEQLKDGYSKVLNAGDSIKFQFNQSYYYVTLENITSKIAISVKYGTTKITSFSLETGDAQKVDINSDKIYELLVLYFSSTNGKPEIFIQEISEEVIEETNLTETINISENISLVSIENITEETENLTDEKPGFLTKKLNLSLMVKIFIYTLAALVGAGIIATIIIIYILKRRAKK